MTRREEVLRGDENVRQTQQTLCVMQGVRLSAGCNTVFFFFFFYLRPPCSVVVRNLCCKFIAVIHFYSSKNPFGLTPNKERLVYEPYRVPFRLQEAVYGSALWQCTVAEMWSDRDVPPAGQPARPTGRGGAFSLQEFGFEMSLPDMAVWVSWPVFGREGNIFLPYIVLSRKGWTIASWQLFPGGWGRNGCVGVLVCGEGVSVLVIYFFIFEAAATIKWKLEIWRSHSKSEWMTLFYFQTLMLLRMAAFSLKNTKHICLKLLPKCNNKATLHIEDVLPSR